MAPPAPPHKIAWQWAEITKPDEVELCHIVNAYRINLNSCNGCRRNVKGNPNCLSGLGEKIWLNDSSLVCESELLREKGSYVGLKNLGATCYANAFLQLWFHMKEVRNAVFSWNKEFYKEEGKETHSSVFEIIACLQEVFALLQFSKRKFVDPTILLNCLLLDNTVQQDAQEFSKLFMSKLEELPNNGGCIFHDFVGRYDYVTSCTSCGNQTRSRSEFYELDLNIVNNKQLSSCLEEFLQQEILEGENQFFCSSCHSKQNATRFIELIQLPATLNLQLLRFVYDKEKHSKKKLSSRLTFPETLDMSPYVNNVKYTSETTLSSSSSSSPTPRDDLTYDLFAILIHRGQLASSGHYVAVIRDIQKGTTCQFNDEKVTQLDEDLSGSDLDNASEEDNVSVNNNNGSSKVKKIKPCKGEMSLANAYMLVYKRRDVAVSACEEMKFEDLSDELKKKVVQHNEELEQDILDEKQKQEKVIEKKDSIKLLYSTVMSYEGSSAEDKLEKFEFIPTQNLVKFLRLNEIGPANKATSAEESKKETAQVLTCFANEDNGDSDNAGTALNTDSHDDDDDGGNDNDGGKFYCKHKKLNPDDVINFKLLPTDVVDHLVEQLSLENRLRCSDVVCRDCVIDRCRSINAKMSLNEDGKKISGLMKSKNYKPQGFLVGKESWRNWRKRAERNLLLEGGDEGSGDYSEGDNRETDLSTLELVDQIFNFDLLCAHNKLDPNEQNWKPVSVEVWQILKKYFLGCPEFPFGASCCEICENKSLQERLFLNESKQQAVQLKQLLNDLYLNRKRPQLSILKKQQKHLNEVSSNKLQPKSLYVPNNNEINCNNNNNCSVLQEPNSVKRPEDMNVDDDDVMIIMDSPGQEPSEVTDSSRCQKVVEDDPVKPQLEESCHIIREEQQLLQQQNPQNLRYYLVSSMFIERWKKCYKDASRNEMPTSVCNNLLLCHHHKLLFDPWDFDAVNDVDKEFVLLWSEEWETLKAYICVDQEIYVELSCGASSDPCLVVSSPELCVECLEERQREVLESRYKYEKAKIYICRLDGAETDASATATYHNSTTANLSLNNSNPISKTFNSYNVEMQDKPYFDEKLRKRKLDEESTFPSEKYPRLECSSAVRRSGRRSKSRAEKEVVVSSTMTLRQLNFEIFRLFQVYKTNQVLYMDGRELVGDDCTLEELCVPPEALIKLEVHEDSDENFIVNTTGGIEEGFKGTGLVG